MTTQLTPQKLAETVKNTKCSVMKFSASWCGPCKNPKFLEDYRNICKLFDNSRDVFFYQFDVDKDENLINDETYYNFNIQAVPTIKIFNYDKEIKEFTGIPNMEQLKNIIVNVLQK